MEKLLFEWQEKCLAEWFNNKCKGIVNVTTGAGKTVMALAAISELEKNNSCSHGIRYKIVVPKVFLVQQWKKALVDELGVSADHIGCYYGVHKDKPDKTFMIYVINSARYSLARHVLSDFNDGYSVFLIADECHHYGSKENYKIFDFLPVIAGKSVNYYSLGLSATPETPAYNENLIPVLGREIYKYSISDAVESDIICDFAVFNIRLDFSEEEKIEYNDYTYKMGKIYTQLMNIYPVFAELPGDIFFAELRRIAGKSDSELANLAEAFLTLTYKRTELVHFASARRACTRELIRCLRDDTRIIIFGERIEMAEAIYGDLSKICPGQVGKYHSLMSVQEKRNVLYRYRNFEIRILVSCRALDEGLNVPETDVGIVVSSTQTDRQRIQRLGRILRRKDPWHIAKLYYLFLDTSYEYTEFLNLSSDKVDRIKAYNMSFDSKTLEFQFPEYEYLSYKAFEKISTQISDPRILSELKKNIRKGIVNSDFLMTEESCRERIESAISKDERNYYITMLNIITEWRRDY